MKTIRLPEVIDLVDITSESSGLILEYKQNKPVGYLAFNDDLNWHLFDTMGCRNYATISASLVDLCSLLVKTGQLNL